MKNLAIKIVIEVQRAHAMCAPLNVKDDRRYKHENIYESIPSTELTLYTVFSINFSQYHYFPIFNYSTTSPVG